MKGKGPGAQSLHSKLWDLFRVAEQVGDDPAG
ncbi:MAG: hypothetical protein JWL98_597 [Xanthomonadaceae bacterium]|nr:hypothetical protein [Xanthomonadaceae bacterium]